MIEIHSRRVLNKYARFGWRKKSIDDVEEEEL